MGKKSKKKKAGGGAPASSVEPLAASITREQATNFDRLAGDLDYSPMSEQDVQTCVLQVNARGAVHGIQPILDAPSKEEHKVSNLARGRRPNRNAIC